MLVRTLGPRCRGGSQKPSRSRAAGPRVLPAPRLGGFGQDVSPGRDAISHGFVFRLMTAGGSVNPRQGQGAPVQRWRGFGCRGEGRCPKLNASGVRRANLFLRLGRPLLNWVFAEQNGGTEGGRTCYLRPRCRTTCYFRLATCDLLVRTSELRCRGGSQKASRPRADGPRVLPASRLEGFGQEVSTRRDAISHGLFLG